MLLGINRLRCVYTASSLFFSRYVDGTKVWDARQEEITMRGDWDETGCDATSTDFSCVWLTYV